jgi:hypothetical protein
LLKYAFKVPQERILKKRSAFLEFAVSVAPLQQAVPAEKWDEHVKMELERFIGDRAKTADLVAVEKQRKDIELKLKEHVELQNALHAKQG